ncbi:MAG TPA: PAS domain S-box protein [Rubrobacteraceae bacterium]|nr:PAS domain S-box protein [Rubrobacteraceae bacterium]
MTNTRDREPAGKALSGSTAFARFALDSLSAHIAIVDDSGSIVWVNKPWREFAASNGAVGNVAEGANYLQVCQSAIGSGSEEAVSFAEAIRSVLSGEQEEFTLEYPCHSPTEQRWFIGRVTRFPADGPPCAVVAHENITERKQAEEALKESEERFRAFFDTAAAGAAQADPATGRFLGVNDKLCRLLGYHEGELLAMTTSDITHPEDRARDAEGLSRLLRSEIREYTTEKRYLRKDERIVWTQLAVSLVRDRSGRPLHTIAVIQDITERKQAEEALHLTDQAVVASSSGIVITDPKRPDNPIVYANPAFERITGYSAQEVLGRNCRLLQGTDRDQPALKELRKALQKGSYYKGSLRNYKKDGTLFWNELSISPVHDEKGWLTNFIGVQTDVTQRKRAEEALRDSKERYRVLYEDNPSMYFTLDVEGTVLSVNRFGSKRLGYAPEELIGRSVLNIFHNDDRENILQNFNACLKDPKQTGSWEARKVRKDGSVLWVQENVRVVRDSDGDTIVLVTCEDITERKRAERERAQLLVRERSVRAEAETAQERLRTILDNLNEGVLVADPQGGVVFANPAAYAMLGTTSEQTLEELPELWEEFYLPEAVAHCAQNRENIEARVSYGESYMRIKLECLANNERGEVLVVMQDLSEGHRLETNQQRFLANAAHQLRTPTMAIMGAAELLATGEDANPATRRRLLDHIFSEGRRMQRLSAALLRLSRVGWDLREPNLEVVNLRKAGQQAAELMGPLAESAGLRVIIEGEEANVHTDPEWLQEVLLVLFSNAIKHSSRGGEIRLRTRDGSVTVEDEGVGISPDDLPYIFERFYRGKGSSEGFGLGLSISRELVERMGGGIFIQSREGTGTTVEIELPKVDPNAQHNDS